MLSVAATYLHHLRAECSAVAAGAWAALRGELPALHSCEVCVRSLSEQSMDAMGDLCQQDRMMIMAGRTRYLMLGWRPAGRL